MQGKMDADGAKQVLRGLISYHERMTMGAYPERDFYLEALKFALASVEAVGDCEKTDCCS